MAGKKSMKGKRYSEEEKQKIVSFVQQFNSEKGRGGASAATKKFGISAMTVSSWVASAKSTDGVKPKKSDGERQGSRNRTLESLLALDRQIAAKRNELAKLEAEFEKLKARL